MLRTHLLAMPRFVRIGIAIDRAPAGVWLGLLAAALLPTWWWMARRLLDGSDDPLGILALASLLVLAWASRRSLRASPRLGWLSLALGGAVACSTGQGVLPPLLCALCGLLAVGAALAAFLPARIASAPVLGLSVLSLPLLASLQFYAGYALRVVTAEASRWLLAPLFAVERTGSSLRVDGQLVIVDAPCSGVQMLWLGEYTACLVALFVGLRNRAFLARLPAVSALLIAGNVVRNTVLVGLEASGHAPPRWAHEAVGLLVLAAVCTAIAVVMHAPREPRHA